MAGVPQAPALSYWPRMKEAASAAALAPIPMPGRRQSAAALPPALGRAAPRGSVEGVDGPVTRRPLLATAPQAPHRRPRERKEDTAERVRGGREPGPERRAGPLAVTPPLSSVSAPPNSLRAAPPSPEPATPASLHPCAPPGPRAPARDAVLPSSALARVAGRGPAEQG